MKKIAILVAATVAACGPQYRTETNFIPPQTDAGRACVFQCDNVQLQCRQLADARAQNQTLLKQQEYNQCLANAQASTNPYASLSCSNTPVSASYGNCTGQYEQCYRTCGGQVQKTTYCVSGCD